MNWFRTTLSQTFESRAIGRLFEATSCIGITCASFQVEEYFDDLREQLIISVRGCMITLSESFRNRKLILSGPGLCGTGFQRLFFVPHWEKHLSVGTFPPRLYNCR